MVLGIIIKTVTVNLVVDICSVNSLNIIAADGMLPYGTPRKKVRKFSSFIYHCPLKVIDLQQ